MNYKHAAVYLIAFIILAGYVVANQRYWHYQDLGVNGDAKINGTLTANTIVADGDSVNGDFSADGKITAGTTLVGVDLDISDDADIDDVALIGPAAADTNYPNAHLISSEGDVGFSSTVELGMVGEAVASATSRAAGILGVGYNHGQTDGYGVWGYSMLNSSASITTGYGGYFQSLETHVGGPNVAVYGDAQNGSSNYSFYGENGYLYNRERVQIGDGDTADQTIFSMDVGFPMTLEYHDNVLGYLNTYQGALWNASVRDGDSSNFSFGLQSDGQTDLYSITKTSSKSAGFMFGYIQDIDTLPSTTTGRFYRFSQESQQDPDASLKYYRGLANNYNVFSVDIDPDDASDPVKAFKVEDLLSLHLQGSSPCDGADTKGYIFADTSDGSPCYCDNTGAALNVADGSSCF